MTHPIKIIPGLPCPSCGGDMYLREPHQRSAECVTCGYSRAVRKTAQADGKTLVTFGKQPRGKIVAFRVTDEQWQALGGVAANQRVEKLALDFVASRGKMQTI